MAGDLDVESAQEILGDIAHACGVRLVLSAYPPDDAQVMGEPPTDATLCLVDGVPTVFAPTIENVRDVEAVLHELAHAVHGLDEEWRAFEQAALWALRIGPAVALRVARMAWETGDQPMGAPTAHALTSLGPGETPLQLRGRPYSGDVLTSPVSCAMVEP